MDDDVPKLNFARPFLRNTLVSFNFVVKYSRPQLRRVGHTTASKQT